MTLFNSAFGLQLTIPQIVREIVRFIKADQNSFYKVIIGTDSRACTGLPADFVTAIVVHRVGKGGRYFWRQIDGGTFYNLHDRIIQEVLFSIDAAHDLLTELKKEPHLMNWSFEIHADVGENGPTKALIQEVVGIVRGNNFEVKTKPESFAASHVADKHT